MELTLDQALQKGVEAHKAGKVQEADRYYTAILSADPKHPDANHNMGVLAVGVGKVQEALAFFKTALEANPSIGQYWLSYIDALIKLERIVDAKAVFDQAKGKGAKGDKFDQLEESLVDFGKGPRTSYTSTKWQELPKVQHQALLKIYKKGKYQETLDKISELLEQFPESANLYNILGAVNKKLGKLEEAIEAYNRTISLNPNFVDAYYNMGNALSSQGQLWQAIEAYSKVISIQPDFADAYNNMGNAFKAHGKLEEALEAYRKAIDIKPDYADAYYNMGNALNDQAQLKDAIEAYQKAIAIKPNHADAYNNMGNALKEQGKLVKAVEAFNKALSLKPNFTESHRNLSSIKKYSLDDEQFLQVRELYGEKALSDGARCNLSFTLSKMYEDIGRIDQSFIHLSQGNALRKKSLNYSINQDIKIFNKLKKTEPYLRKCSLQIKENCIEPTPIFILGMPRSGTTLVEQIVSSHSEVTGAGELNNVLKLGGRLALDFRSTNPSAISKFRDKYLSELSKLSKGKLLVTDKMPQNFRFIPLICAAFPEAKIVHVKRNASATCWSNYKQYFSSNALGYCYDLSDVVEYYNLYKDLMELWQLKYGKKIYHLIYESLTTDQENQTRKLINHLDLTWDEACLSPHKNKRSVRTSSQQQVRQKVFQGSSEAWRKYEQYLDGAFDSLIS